MSVEFSPTARIEVVLVGRKGGPGGGVLTVKGVDLINPVAGYRHTNLHLLSTGSCIVSNSMEHLLLIEFGIFNL